MDMLATALTASMKIQLVHGNPPYVINGIVYKIMIIDDVASRSMQFLKFSFINQELKRDLNVLKEACRFTARRYILWSNLLSSP